MNENNERVVLLIGGAGYVGNVLARRLLEEGYGVRVLDQLIFGHGSAIAPLTEHPRFELEIGDLRDREALERALEGATDVALLAGLVGDPVCKKYPELAQSINHDGCAQVLEAIGGRPIDRFVFTSTCSNYGLRDTDEPATEESDLAPLSLYAEHKVAMEGMILGEQDTGFTPTVLRIATAYGLSQRMRFDLTITEFARTLAAGEELVVYDADTWRPYCHIADISKAVMTVLESPVEKTAGEIFNVGHSDENYTKRMVVDAVQEALDGAGTVSYVEGGVDARNYRVSFDKIAERLGFVPDHRVPGAVRTLCRMVEAGAYHDFESRRDFYTNHTIAPERLEGTAVAGSVG